DPVDLQWDQLPAQLARPGRLADEVVVDDEETTAAGRLHLDRHVAGRAMVLAGAVKGRDRAEVALEVAAAGELDQGDLLVSLASEDVSPGPKPRQGAPARAVVAALKPVAPRVVEDLGPDRFGIADDDRIRLPRHLVRHKCRVVASQ